MWSLEKQRSICRRCSRIVKQRLLATSCLSVRLSVLPSAWDNWAPNERILMNFNGGVFFENLSRKLKFSSNSDKNIGYFAGRSIEIY